MHNFGWMFVQATVAILILVGFESCTALGGEAVNPKRDIPIAVITSLLVQGAFCYLIEYFGANYFLNSGYTMQSATGSAAPIGDMMIVVGDALFGAGHGRIFMLFEAITVFMALIGTTLACINTGARVTYAMGRDQEVPEHFGMLHDKNLSPHRAIWTLTVVSIIVAVIGLLMVFGDGSASTLTDQALAALPHGFWSSVWFATSQARLASMPNSLLTVTLASNFGTFMLYGLSCLICIVGYQGHPNYSFLKHTAIPIFGLVANLACMVFYLIGPFMGFGTPKEPLLALGIAAVWAIYGAIYFVRSSKATGRTTMVASRPSGA
jgi:amino acid transporter